jgi:hypothetical protein
MLDLLLETLDETISTMATVFLMLFITGIMTEMNAFRRISFLAKPWYRYRVCPILLLHPL